MLGFPYFYGNEDLDQDENFMIFSLDPIPKNADLNLPQIASLTIIGETGKLGLGDEFAYEFCDKISQVCATFHVIPETKTIVLDYNGFCMLVSNSDLILDSVSSKLVIPKEAAMQEALNFFKTTNVIVQAGGVQGTLYKVGSYLQSAGSAGLVTQTVGLAKVAGVTGLQILKAQPALVIAIPTTGAIFFYGCGAIAGKNVVGKVLITTGDALAIPMKCTEILWNSYGNPVIQKIFGIPLILNMTQSFKIGPGYTLEEITKYISFNKKSVFKVVKDKTIDSLSQILEFLKK